MNNNSKILVTGATGLVGSYIVRLLLQRGYNHITCMKRPSSDLSFISDFVARVNWVDISLSNIPEIYEVMDGIHTVIHSAAEVTYDPAKRNSMMEVNQQGTANLINAALESDINTFAFVSSVAAIARKSTVNFLDEEVEWIDSIYNTDYGVSKYLAETEVWRGMAEGLDVLIINPSFILGSGDFSRSSLQMYQKVAKGLKYYPGGSNGFVDVRDVAKILVMALEKNIRNERIIVSAENSTYKEILKKMAEAMNIAPPQKKIPDFLGKLMVGVEKMRSFFFGAVPLITRQSFRHLQMKNAMDNSKSRKLFDYEYIPLDETISESSKYFMSNYYKPLSFKEKQTV